MDIDVSLVEDCRRLAKQCKMEDLIEELENKCKQVYEYGKIVSLVHVYTANTYMCITNAIRIRAPRLLQKPQSRLVL